MTAENPDPMLPAGVSGEASVAILAGGCFWCTEAVFQRVSGVLGVEPGYIGGEGAASANYEAVCRGDTGHAEAVRVRFDPERITYDDILAVFFATHDPTQLNRQGNDIGTQYRSAIFWTTPAQRDAASAFMAELEHSGVFAAPVVTRLVEAGEFHPAEPYHHDYFNRNPQQAYCSYIIGPKLAKFRDRFRHLLAESA